MKKTSKRILTAIFCAIIISSALVSCSDTEDDSPDIPNYEAQDPQNIQTLPPASEAMTEKPSSPTVENPSNDSHDIQIDTYKEQISYYMSLTESLQADLLKLKEETYIDECEYQLQIETLEGTIQDLKDTISALNSSSNPPSTLIPPTSSGNDTLSARLDYKYTTANGEVTIIEYTGNELDVEIPSVINGSPVVYIGEEAFKGKQIRSLVIPSGVKKIDWFAFSGCTVLESITVPSSVMSVGYGAFDYCPKSMTVKCMKGSYIEAYAKSWGIKVLAE